MRNLILGLILGLAAGVISYFIFVPSAKEQAYITGYDKGKTEGFSKGVEEGKVIQMRYNDSVTHIHQVALETERKAAKPALVKEKPDYNINYTMNGDDVGEEKIVIESNYKALKTNHFNL